MIKIHRDASALPYGAVMEIYHDDLLLSGKRDYPDLTISESLHEAQQDFYGYLTEEFFSSEGAFIAILEDKASLRIEPYLDGFLLTGMSVAPAFRRRGYAKTLLGYVVSLLPGGSKLYSHVDKQNIPSVGLHRDFGFSVEQDGAQMLDGSFLHNFWTFSYRIKP